MTDVAQAFVPGHVTGFFTTHDDDDPTRAGSQGGGIALSTGVTVTVRPADRSGVVFDGTPVEMGAVDRVLETLEARAAVRAVTDLPLASGFGVSGAVALGTALAVNETFDRRLSTNELVTIAHGAEVQAGTGLGDVVAQARGGITIRLEPGGPHHNVLDGIPARERIEYLTLGDLPTADVLAGNTDPLDEAGRQALSMVVEEPTVDSFVRASRRFSRESELITEDVHDVVTDVNEAGGQAAMAMLGRTVFALDTGLSDAGYDPEVCRVHHPGATLQAPPQV
jgi:pantoate kinase